MAGPSPAGLHSTISRYTGLRYHDTIFSHDTSPREQCLPRQVDLERNVVVQVRESNAVLSTDRLTNDNLVDVIELIPVLVSTMTTCRHS